MVVQNPSGVDVLQLQTDMSATTEMTWIGTGYVNSQDILLLIGDTGAGDQYQAFDVGASVVKELKPLADEAGITGASRDVIVAAREPFAARFRDRATHKVLADLPLAWGFFESPYGDTHGGRPFAWSMYDDGDSSDSRYDAFRVERFGAIPLMQNVEVYEGGEAHFMQVNRIARGQVLATTSGNVIWIDD